MKVGASESFDPRKPKETAGHRGSATAPAGDRALGMNARICRRDF